MSQTKNTTLGCKDLGISKVKFILTFFSKEYNAAKSDSSHPMNWLYITCLREAKEEMDRNSALRKKITPRPRVPMPGTQTEVDTSFGTQELLNIVNRKKRKL